ncbi:RdgB/HAM1 family non-canonical purine NTP pyrophosphatase [Mangrovitalea sediminis]|uniref:RdgB/HAM1 family non-canonical purine NTP pyrophosphatase n=1 Tax=Mangrovitalea sediminis TaxID=1982043 RepID=UPI000BE4D810|nr:RdgB/HAM1 family non-canonical purine NTP pyrophosphatase [Mangrovitalea sediminis]
MTEKTTLVLASNNTGKIRELTDLLSPLGFSLAAQGTLGVEPAEETAVTFVENALIKARHASRITGLPALADDSGLAVDALDGAPGVFSARYAGETASDADNNAKLLEALKAVPEEQRTASFHCVLVYLRHAEDPTPIICHGTWHGRILSALRGEQGFGYDPLFWVAERQCAAAELSRAEKSQLSHRGQALRQLVEALRTERT